MLPTPCGVWLGVDCVRLFEYTEAYPPYYPLGPISVKISFRDILQFSIRPNWNISAPHAVNSDKDLINIESVSVSTVFLF
jgi:hypothetical protein